MIDSGIGGLPYLERAREMLPRERYAYVADNAHFPYGEKDNETLVAEIAETVGLVIARVDPAVIVLACNTASVVALAHLRSQFGVPFVGVVPAVKPARSVSRNRRIGLLATKRTVHDRYTDDLIARFASDCYVERVGDGSIVSFVEERLFQSNREERIGAVRKAAETFAAAGVDTVVLGCTHFLYVEEELRSLLPPKTAILDSRDGVVRQLCRVVAELPRSNPTTTDSKDAESLLYVTREPETSDRYRSYAEQFRLAYGGVLA
jgi:glutamate racemase